MKPRAARVTILLAALPWLAASAAAHAQPSDIAVKAAFLPKFTRYIEFPPAALPAAGAPYYLCVIGRDPFGTLIDDAASREVVDGHPIAVRRFGNTDPGAVAGCSLAFVAGADDRETERMVQSLRHQPTVTITDEQSGRARGMIHFVIADGRVRFYIDEADAAARGIGISSRLLALAIRVKQRAS